MSKAFIMPQKLSIMPQKLSFVFQWVKCILDEEL